ncbi:NAD(P)H-quinone oxidoreductase subunit J [Moorella thermoacetica]|uniref:NADH-quinone oxidoreductase subunit C n=1 Tax=Neomoorella thermoacetica TaxID=1525 RepID=A0A5D3I8T9_NEOTH|nr:NADH-quinone oxidoreductase subunit C [Moorella thermoacetica]AOQ23660.1 NADH-quinone oxidoreductase subunit 5 [Moorella thermoacetica]OIQ10884.1 NADH-quinone oxidoreductase subunit 5 [Moorella thermoacetica]TYL13844.1 NAD(P)H-quinone oxidoreductase subunit J [Moorella thermoacetica]
MDNFIQELQRLFPDLEVREGVDVPALVVPADQLLALMTELKEKRGFNFLADLTAVDYPEDERIEMVYHLLSVPGMAEIRVKVNLDRQHPEVPSLTALWPAANVQEREAFDLMGVKFPGHPDLRRILCPDDFVGHPLRKDFRLQTEGGE